MKSFLSESQLTVNASNWFSQDGLFLSISFPRCPPCFSSTLAINRVKWSNYEIWGSLIQLLMCFWGERSSTECERWFREWTSFLPNGLNTSVWIRWCSFSHLQQDVFERAGIYRTQKYTNTLNFNSFQSTHFIRWNSTHYISSYPLVQICGLSPHLSLSVSLSLFVLSDDLGAIEDASWGLLNET